MPRHLAPAVVLLAAVLGPLVVVLAGGVAEASGPTSPSPTDGVRLVLAPRVTHELRDGDNFLGARGAATKHARGDRVVLTLPLRLTYPDHGRRAAGTSTTTAGSDPVSRLAGVVRFGGRGPRVTWHHLRIDATARKVTAVVDAERRTLLRVSADGGLLRLSRAGARSLNRAARGAPFHRGEVFGAGVVGLG